MNKLSERGDNESGSSPKPLTGKVGRHSVEILSKIASLVGMTSNFPGDGANPSEPVMAVEVVSPLVIPPPPDVPREFLAQIQSVEAAAVPAELRIPKKQKPAGQPSATSTKSKQKPSKGTTKNSIIPIPMENGKPSHKSPLVLPGGSIVVTDLVREVLPVSEINDMLAMAMNQELNKLRFRMPNLIRARDMFLNQIKQNNAQRIHHMYTGSYISEPRKTEAHPFTAMAIARFLKEVLPREELYFGLMVAIPYQLNQDYVSKCFHFVTVIGFNRNNRAHGKSLMENPKKMIFIDASSPDENFEDKLIVDTVSNMQKYYKFRPFKPEKEEHRYNVPARDAFNRIYEWSNRELDHYSQFLLDAIKSPDTLSQFDYDPDLFAESLQTSLGHGNDISAEVRRKTLAALGVPEMLVEAIAKAADGETKIMSDVRRELLNAMGTGVAVGEKPNIPLADDEASETAGTAEKKTDTASAVFDQNKIDTLVAMLGLRKAYLR